ncbi:hypothetical protein C8R43DRAFT_42000 [Mycena crocata]|nr:hypothetical protein C8R43DRAFT_42000 [Mycena crocata]
MPRSLGPKSKILPRMHCAPYKAYSTTEDSAPHHHWCFLGEIVKDEDAVVRLILGVKDSAGEYIRVAFYFDNDAEFDYRSVKLGSTIAVMYAERHNFLDGSYGLRLEHPKFVKIFPCGLETLLRINDDIESETPVDSAQKCKGCGNEEHPDKLSLSRCSRCLGASYCGKECQTDAWNRGHKRECKIYKAVDELKRSRDWNGWRAMQAEGLEWIGFGQKETPLERGPVDPDPPIPLEWKNAKPAVVTELQATFTITSGIANSSGDS